MSCLIFDVLILLCVLVGMWLIACLTFARVAAATYDECRHPPRGGISLFGGTPSNLRIAIVQCGNTAVDFPDFGSLVDGSPRDFDNIPYGVQSIYMNALYAAAHGYKYEYYVFNSKTIERYPTWCRVPTMRRSLTQRHPPDMALYLDLDAYIRTDLPMSNVFEKTNRARAMCLDDGLESQPCIYPRVNITPPLYKGMPMPELQRSFEDDPVWPTLMRGVDIVNSGGGWLERNTGNVTWLDEWWDLGSTWEGGRYERDQYHEQRILNVLMAGSSAMRKETLLLEDPIYNSPRSVCMPHMYAIFKEGPEVRRQMAADLLARLRRVSTDRVAIHVMSGTTSIVY